jgi:hypothetical protein
MSAVAAPGLDRAPMGQAGRRVKRPRVGQHDDGQADQYGPSGASSALSRHRGRQTRGYAAPKPQIAAYPRG